MMNIEPLEKKEDFGLVDLLKLAYTSRLIIFIITIFTVLSGLTYWTISDEVWKGSIKVTNISSSLFNNYSDLITYNEYFKIVNPDTPNSGYLRDLFIEEVSDREKLLEVLSRVNGFNKDSALSDREFQKKMKVLANNFTLYSPIVSAADIQVTKRAYQPFWLIEYESNNRDEIAQVISEILNKANDNLNVYLTKLFKQTVKDLSDENEKNIKNSKTSLENAIKDYEFSISVRLAFLEEQATIARLLNVENSLPFYPTNDSSFSKGSPYIDPLAFNFSNDTSQYFRNGYKAIEKEIELITNRQDHNLFVPNITIYKSKIRELEQKSLVEDMKKAYNKTPINSADFIAATYDIGSLEIEKISTGLFVILFFSLVVGILLSIFFILLQFLYINILK